MSDVLWLIETGPETPELPPGTEIDIQIAGVDIKTRTVDTRQVSFNGLDLLTERFLNNMTEVVLPPLTARCVALVQTDLTEQHGDKVVKLPANIMKLFWAKDVPDFSLPVFPEEELKQGNWINNLEILLDAKNGIGANSPVIFAALECVRKQKQAYIQHMPNTPELKAIWLN